MKNMKLLVLGAVAAVATGVGIVVASGGFSGEGPPTGLAAPTTTPDTGSSVTPQQASNELAAVSPGFAAVLGAIRSGDVDAFLKLVDWSSATCGAGRGSTYCPGVVDGQERPVINVGPDTFLVTADGLRASLKLILTGDPVPLTYASQLKDTPARYLVGFESVVAKGKGLPPVTDPDLQLTGLLLTLDANSKYPIASIDLGVNLESHAIDQAGQVGFEKQRIITASMPSSGTPAPTVTLVPVTPPAAGATPARGTP